MATIIVKSSGVSSFSSGTEMPGSACVGTAWDSSAQGTVTCRYKFTTDGFGATSISFQTSNATAVLRGSSGSEDSIGKIRFTLTTSPDNLKTYSGNGGSELSSFSYGNYIRGSRSINLKPNTVYYLWFFPAPNFSSNTKFNLGNCTITTSGTYGTVSTISASNGTFGSNVPITLTNSVSGVTNTITVSCGGITKTLATKSSATSFTWTPDLNEYGNAIKTAKTATATITTTTYYGSTSWGSSSKTITMSFPSSAGPSIDDVSITYDNSASTALSDFTVFVQGYSKVKATITASAKYNATIDNYSLTVNNATVDGTSNVLTSAPVTTSGEVTATITITDSRGFTASTTRSFTVQPYARPTITSIKMNRADSSGHTAEDGTYLSASGIGNISSVSGQNTRTMTVAYKTSIGSYGTENPIVSGETALIAGLDADTTYIARITLTDKLGNSITATSSIPAQNWAIKFSVASVNGIKKVNACGIGKAPETDKVLEIPHDWEVARKSQDGSRTAHALFEDSAAYEQISTLVNQMQSVLSGIALVVTETGGFSVSTHTAADNTDVTITYQKQHSTTPYLIVAGNNASASVFATPGVVSRSATGAVLRMRNIAAHTYAASFRWYALEAPASITPSETETYNGDYTVVPMAFDEQILQTRSKLMSDDVTVTQVPLYETSNEANGTTAYIAAAQEELSNG